MTIHANDTGSTPVTPSPVTPAQVLPPTVTAYEGVVVNLNNAIDALVAQIPEFQAPHPSTSRFVRTHLNVPLEFIGSAVSAVTESPSLQSSNTLDVTQAREALQFIGAFVPLYEKMRLFTENLKFTINERQARVSVNAQMLYGVAKQFARNADNVGVTGHVRIMKEHLTRAKRSRIAKSPAPAPGTVTTPVTTTVPAPGSGTVTTPVTTTVPVPVAQPHITSQEAGGSSKQ